MTELNNNDISLGIEKTFNISKFLSTFLVQKSIKTEEQIYKILNKDFNLINPFIIPDFKKAIDRIIFAIKNQEKIIIFGDYDVDGMLASASLFLFLKKLNANVDVHLPDKIKDGYGFSNEQITKLKDIHNVSLIISVDTGSTAISEAKFIKDQGIDLIITDHHELDEIERPDCFAFINPKVMKKSEERENLKNLCGVGLAFYLIRGINSLFFNKGKRISLTNYVVLAMIGTIGDMVPLIGDNRLIVDKGLELLYQTDIIGLQYILNEVFKFEYPKSSDVAFQLVPLINSAGRMNQSYKIIELFSSNDLSVSAKVEELLQINKERKIILEKDLAKIKTNNDLDYNFFYDQSLFFGTIGIIANKLLNESNKVTFVFTKVGDEIKGSARSNQVDLKKFINENKDCFHKAGGHFSAIGFTLKNDLNLKIVEDRLDLFIKSYKKTEKNNTYIELDLAKIDSNFIKQLYILEPFGQGFEAPFVKIGSITNFKEMKIFKDTHIKIQVSDLVEILYFFANKEIYDKLKKAIENNKKYEIYGKIQSTGEKTIILVEKISFE